MIGKNFMWNNSTVTVTVGSTLAEYGISEKSLFKFRFSHVKFMLICSQL